MGKGRHHLPQNHVELHGQSFAELAGFLVDSDKSERASSNDQRRARRDEYRKALDVQVADILSRRENDARRLEELERRDELKSATYNPWGKPGSGAPLRHANDQLVTNVKAYYRAKKQGLIAQDLSPNEIDVGQQPFGFTLTDERDRSYEDGTSLCASRSGGYGHTSTGAVRPSQHSAVLSSPPRSRYRLDRLPPEEQNDLDRRVKDRQELETALLGQVEENRRQKEREAAATRQINERERVKALLFLAEDRAANRTRVRDKNERAGEGLPSLHPAESKKPPVLHGNLEAGCFKKPASWRDECWRDECVKVPTQQRRSGKSDSRVAIRDVGNGFPGSRRRDEGISSQFLSGNGVGDGRGTLRHEEGDRKHVLLVLRKLEDHGKMLAELAAELATAKGCPTNSRAQVGGKEYPTRHETTASRFPSPDKCLGSASLPSGQATTSRLTPLFRAFQEDEDNLDRLLQRFEDHDLEQRGRDRRSAMAAPNVSLR